MSIFRDPDRMIRAFLDEGATQLADPVYDAVRAEIDTKRQRAVIGPWRVPAVSKLVSFGLGAAAVVAVLVVGAPVLRQAPIDGTDVGAAPTPPPATTPPVESGSPAHSPSEAPSAVGMPGGTITFQMDGAPASTTVDLVADGAGVSGTSVTTFPSGTHAVRLECATMDGRFWALAGSVEQSTAESASVGDWSAVIVWEWSPQAVAIWLSDPKAPGSDCASWLGGLELPEIGAENFQPVESGSLVPLPDLSSRIDAAPGGTVTVQLNGAPATTTVDLVADGAGVAGTAVTTFANGPHAVSLECAARDAGVWALAGTVDTSTAEPTSVGQWSAVIVREGSPQAVGIWLSDPKAAGIGCAGWLGGLELSDIGAENFQPVESGVLVPPPADAP